MTLLSVQISYQALAIRCHCINCKHCGNFVSCFLCFLYSKTFSKFIRGFLRSAATFLQIIVDLSCSYGDFYQLFFASQLDFSQFRQLFQVIGDFFLVGYSSRLVSNSFRFCGLMTFPSSLAIFLTQWFLIHRLSVKTGML